jgi:hypothetical protein
MKARARHRIALTGVFVFLAISLPVRALGGVPEVNHLIVTDVTTRSFSVIWASSEASTANLEVYEDEDGTVSVTGAVITPHPVESGNATIATLAEDSGVMKARVTALSPNTTYYFKTITTSKSTPDETYYPETAPFMSVTTESLTTRTYESGADTLPFSNDVIIEPCYLDDGTTPAEGTLLLATLEGANHPLTAFVGDGVDAPDALIDLNNAFSRSSNQNHDCSEGDSLTLVNFRGTEGYSIVTHKVPQDLSLCEVKEGAPGLMQGWNFVAFQVEPMDPNRDTVLSEILGKVSAIWTYETLEDKWYKYLDPDPFGRTDLNEMHSLTGYWIQLADGQEASLKVHGDLAAGATIPLSAGWNLIGIASIEGVDRSYAIGPIEDSVTAIWTYESTEDDWYKYLKPDPFGRTDLYTLRPEQAYWVQVASDSNWTLP